MPDGFASMPFTGGAPADVPQQQETTGLADRWRSWMASPQNRASMIQFGLTLSQPIGPGQNKLGQVGQALGAGGEAADRVTAQQMRESEAESKQSLREAQAGLAESRATAAEARAGARGQSADIALQRLDLARQLMEMRRTQGEFSARLRAQGLWQKEKAAHDLSADADTPFPSFEEWYGSLSGAGAGAAGGVTAPAPAAAGAPKVGEVRRGYRFKGGDPASQSSWEKVQ